MPGLNFETFHSPEYWATNISIPYSLVAGGDIWLWRERDVIKIGKNWDCQREIVSSSGIMCSLPHLNSCIITSSKRRRTREPANEANPFRPGKCLYPRSVGVGDWHHSHIWKFIFVKWLFQFFKLLSLKNIDNVLTYKTL